MWFGGANEHAVAVPEFEDAVGITADGPAAFVQHSVAIAAAKQRAVVEIGCAVVAMPLVEMMGFAMRRINPATRSAAVLVAHDHRAELIG